MNNSIFSKAFTLAEVLITLVIVGVVAAIVIPVMVNTFQDTQYKTAYKKSVSSGDEAIGLAKAKNLFTSATYDEDNNAYVNNFFVFMNQFKVSKQCISGGDSSNCWASGELVYNTYPLSSTYAFIDSSGIAWILACSSTPWLMIDTNNLKGPNQYGKDRFALKVIETDSTTVTILHSTSSLFTRIRPFPDNDIGTVCYGTNKCATDLNYYGTSWLYN